LKNGEKTLKKIKLGSGEENLVHAILESGKWSFEGLLEFEDIKPYVRQTHNSRFTDPRAKAYNANQKMLAGLVKFQIMEDETFGEFSILKEAFGEVIFNVPYRLGLAIIPPKNKSGLLSKQMDFSNFHKAFEDALCYHNVLPGDSFYWNRGMCLVKGYVPGVFELEGDYDPCIHYRICGIKNFAEEDSAS
jgi:hypothetical protein